MSFINPFTVIIAFTVVLALLVYYKPHAERLVTGVFFLIMALGVNVPILLTDPALYAAAGSKALLPVYRWFFTQILGATPVPFIIALILFEVTVGTLILSKGKAVRFGLLGATLFCLFLVPVSIEVITTPLLIVSFVLLMRHEFPLPVWQPLLRAKRKPA